MSKKISVTRLEQVVADETGSGAVGKFVATVVEAALDLRRGLTGEQTSDAMAAYQQAGRRMSALPPYGMMVDPTDNARLVPEPYEQQVVERVIELRDSGLGLRRICKALIEEGLKPRQVRKKIDGEVQYVSGRWRPQLINSIYKRAKAAEKNK